MGNQIANSKRDIRITIRLTGTEYEQLQRQLKQSTDQKLSDLARRKLLGKPVKVFTRNRSLDLLMEEMIRLRRELNFIGNNFNQVVHKINAAQMPGELAMWLPLCKKLQESLLEKIKVINEKINQMGALWLQDS